MLDERGQSSREYYRWRVSEHLFQEAVSINELKVGNEYGVLVREKQEVRSFVLVSVDLVTKVTVVSCFLLVLKPHTSFSPLTLQTYSFRSLRPDIGNIEANEKHLPSIYPARTRTSAYGSVDRVVLESVKQDRHGESYRKELFMKNIAGKKFTLDIGETHVLEAIG